MLAEVFISLKKLVRNKTQQRTHALIARCGPGGQPWINGQISVSLFSEFIGSEPSDTTPAAEEIEVSFENRLRAMLNRYRRQDLPRISEIVATTAAPEAYLEALRRQYGPPPGTYKVMVTIIGCKDLPRLELRGLDPYIRVFPVTDVDDVQTTRIVPHERSPTFNETFTIDLVHSTTDDIVLKVMDYDSTSADDDVGEILIPLRSIPSSAAVTRWLPLPLSASINRSKAMFEGTVGVTLRAIGFNDDVRIDNNEEVIRQRVISLLRRFDRAALPRYEFLMWSNQSPAASLASLVSRYGNEPGTGIVKITLHSVHGLTKDKALSKKPKPYVMINIPVSDGRPCPRTPTCKSASKTITAQGQQFDFDFTCEVDVEHPDRDSIMLSVYDDIVGADFLFGTAELSLKLLYKDASRKRVVPIIQHPGTTNASIGGFVTVTLSTTCFGLPGGPGAAAEFDELDVTNAKRLFGMFSRYQPARMHEVGKLLATTANVPQLLDGLVRQFGPEPGTYRVELTILGCQDLPRIEMIGGGDPYVTIDYEGQPLLRTSCVTCSLGPTFNQTFSLDLIHPANAEIKLTVMDYDANSEDDEWCKLSLPVASLCQAPTTRWIPLIPCSPKKPGDLGGKIGFTARTIGFGRPALPFRQEVEDPFRERVIRLTRRYLPDSLHDYEMFLWEKVGQKDQVSAADLEAGVQSTVQAFGFEPGKGVVKIVIHSVEKLLQDSKVAKKATPYVELELGNQQKSVFLSKTKRTKTQKSPPGPTHPRIEEVFEVDVFGDSEEIKLTVMNDIAGLDYEFGTVMLSLKSLQRGVAKKRTHPIVGKAGTSEACVQGYLTVSIETQCFGQPGALDEEMDNVWSRRLLNMYKKYNRYGMHTVDSVVKKETELQLLVQKYGPEPGTFRVHVTVIGCKKLPAIEMGGCDPYVIVSCMKRYQTSPSGEDLLQTRTMKSELNPTFNESFELDVTNITTDYIRLLVMDYDASSEDDEVAAINIPLCSIFNQPVTRWLPLALIDSAVKPCGSEIGVTLRCYGFGEPAPRVSPEIESAFRTRCVKMYDRYRSSNIPDCFEMNLWKYATFERALQDLVTQMGPEPGSRQLTLTIVGITGLKKEGKAATSAKAYAQFDTAFVQELPEAQRRTKTPAAGAADHPSINQQFTFEIQTVKSHITITIYDDVYGADYVFGSVTITAELLAVNVVKTRTIPIYRANSSSDSRVEVVGFVTVALFSPRLGYSGALDDEMEITYASRLRRLFARWAPYKLPEVDSLVAKNWPANLELMIAEAVQQCGPEPGTFVLHLDVVSHTITASGLQGPFRFDVDPDTTTVIAERREEPSRPHYELDMSNECDDRFTLFMSAVAQPQKILASVNICVNVCDRSGLVVTRPFLIVKTSNNSAEIVGEVTIAVRSARCGRIGVPVASAAQQEMELLYRERLIRLFKRSCPSQLPSVDTLIYGSTASELALHICEQVGLLGEEDGQTTVAARIVSIDDLTDRTALTSVYAKIHLNEKTVAKRLAADCALSKPADFSAPVDCLHVRDSDMLVVKLAVAGAVGSAVLGRASFPVRFVVCGSRSSDSTPELARYLLPLWCYNESTRAYAGRVTVEFQVKGFPAPPTVALSLLPSKEVIGTAWRIYAEPNVPMASFFANAPLAVLDFATKCAESTGQAPVGQDTVYLHIVSCRVPKMDTFGTCDTFVELAGATRQPRTSIVSGTLSPVFRFNRDDHFCMFGDAAAAVFELVEPRPSNASRERCDQPITLNVSDMDRTTSELIGSVTLSSKLLLAGLWNVDPVQLAAVTLESRGKWIDENRRSLLTLPLILRKDEKVGEVRGEITLATTFSSAAFTHLQAKLDSLNRVRSDAVFPALAASQRILLHSKQWVELEQLHWFVGHQLLDGSGEDLLLKAPSRVAPLAERSRLLIEAMTKEFGAPPTS